eukprot:COSAG04_NODE_7730_length_1077_cov_1.476483_3_plen_31_part_01
MLVALVRMIVLLVRSVRRGPVLAGGVLRMIA